MLDKIRSDLGSSQNQLKATLHNISGTRVNLLAAESQIRDVDFALESMNFKTYTLLAQAGTYAITQAELIQQNILKLLQ
jgi:flagellin